MRAILVALFPTCTPNARTPVRVGAGRPQPAAPPIDDDEAVPARKPEIGNLH
jgi:hypothetical protein